MDLTSLRSLVRSLNFATHGVDATIEADDDSEPLETRAIWLTPATEDQPSGGFELHRRERSYVLALPRVELVEHGTIINAPRPAFDEQHGAIERWRVDGILGIEADHIRVRLIPDPIEAT